jgi:ATP-dependent Clp protease ATP-binding subunit ClpC
VKQVAKFMFNTEESIIRLDMSEYSMKHEVSKLIGSPPGFVGSEDGGQLTEKVKNKPYSIILFDEFEKAHPDFKNMMLQILDEGFLTDAKGRRVNFKNTIIVMTSNIGTSKLSNESSIGFNSKDNSSRNIEAEVMSELKKHPTASPEFLNRIDEVIVFKKLEKDSLEKIVDLNLNKLASRLLRDKKMKVKFSKAIKEHVIEKGYDPILGARPMNRAITNIVEKAISDAFIVSEIEDGDKFTVDIKNDKPFIKK